jgi:hypothetical protein
MRLQHLALTTPQLQFTERMSGYFSTKVTREFRDG